MHFTTLAGGSNQMSSWSTSQVFALPSDVAPSGSVTLSAGVTAPTSSAGPMSLEAELFKNQQYWFTEAKAKPVTVNYHWQASVDVSAAPTSWAANQSQNLSITVTNHGDQTWVHNGSNPVELDMHFTTRTGGSAQISSWLTSQVFPLPSDVAPGGSLTFSVMGTAPNTAGSMSLEGTMFKNQQFWFQQSAAVGVTVAPATWAATYSFSPPGIWVKAQTQSVSITLNNTGNQTWVH